MNKLILFLILAGFSLAGCHEVTVGFMKTENANYPIDTLRIFDTVAIRQEIAYLEIITKNTADSLTMVQDSLTVRAEELEEEATSRFVSEITIPSRELDGLLDDSLNHVAEIKILKEKIAKAHAEIDPLYDEADACLEQANEIAEILKNMDSSGNEEALATLKDLRQRVTRKVLPWTTSEIEGVDGTAPIFFYIESVRAEGGGNAEIFLSDLRIKGNGRMEVPYAFQAPAGIYHVSIRIENEGYSRVVEDVFTFIINPAREVKG